MKTSLPGERFTLFDRFFAYLKNLKPSDRLIVKLLLLTVVVSGATSLYLFNQKYIIKIPTTGGVLVEGVVGSPRFVNPVLASTHADTDLTALTYSGLLRLSEDGKLENNLAQNVTISDDGLTYSVALHQDKYFSDGTPVKAEDVAYTIALIQNPDIKSPLRGNWSGVTVEVVNGHEINFVLEKAYAPFIENLTIGILPKHVWSNLSPEEFPFSQHNTEPIGSGPYKVSLIKRDNSGLISEYQLVSTENSNNIKDITLRFYQNDTAVKEAMKNNLINATAALSEQSLDNVSGEWKIEQTPLPRVFSLFFNQNKSTASRDLAARNALEVMIDKNELIKRAANGYGNIATSPIPYGFSESNQNNEYTGISLDERLEKAKQILTDGGWKQADDGHWDKKIDDSSTRLAFTVRTANTSVFEDTATYLVEVWRALGVDVNVELYEQTDLVQTVIRPRDYQILLFGIDVGRPLDLYSFWHSSQREDPGLNAALYTNITTDKLLEKIRTEHNGEEKDSDLANFISEIEKDKPAIFLFSPTFIYVTGENIHTAKMSRLSKSSERFSNISSWYIKEDTVWPLFQ